MKVLKEATVDEKKFYKHGITVATKSADWAKNYAEHETTELHRAPEYDNNPIIYYRALRAQWFKAAEETWDKFEKQIK